MNICSQFGVFLPLRVDDATRAAVAKYTSYEKRAKYRIAVILYFCQYSGMRYPLNISDRGVITLPAKLRRALGISANDQLIAEATPEGVLLRPAVTIPVEIYSDERIREFDDAETDLAVALDFSSVTPSTTRD